MNNYLYIAIFILETIVIYYFFLKKSKDKITDFPKISSFKKENKHKESKALKLYDKIFLRFIERNNTFTIVLNFILLYLSYVILNPTASLVEKGAIEISWSFLAISLFILILSIQFLFMLCYRVNLIKISFISTLFIFIFFIPITLILYKLVFNIFSTPYSVVIKAKHYPTVLIKNPLIYRDRYKPEPIVYKNFTWFDIKVIDDKNKTKSFTKDYLRVFKEFELPSEKYETMYKKEINKIRNKYKKGEKLQYDTPIKIENSYFREDTVKLQGKKAFGNIFFSKGELLDAKSTSFKKYTNVVEKTLHGYQCYFIEKDKKKSYLIKPGVFKLTTDDNKSIDDNLYYRKLYVKTLDANSSKYLSSIVKKILINLDRYKLKPLKKGAIYLLSTKYDKKVEFLATVDKQSKKILFLKVVNSTKSLCPIIKNDYITTIRIKKHQVK